MGRESARTGSVGENAAALYLKKKGYRIIGRNYRTIYGEIDIVAMLGNTVVFVEVKARLTPSLGPPYLAVTKTKQSHIIKNALFYLKSRRLTGAPWRIDIVSVNLDRALRVEKIELFENAVEDPYV
jgi:putative endonuclease